MKTLDIYKFLFKITLAAIVILLIIFFGLVDVHNFVLASVAQARIGWGYLTGNISGFFIALAISFLLNEKEWKK